MFSVIGVAVPVLDMIVTRKINGDNGTNFLAGAATFIPGGGFIIAPLLGIFKWGDSKITPMYEKKMLDFPLKNIPEPNVF